MQSSSQGLEFRGKVKSVREGSIPGIVVVDFQPEAKSAFISFDVPTQLNSFRSDQELLISITRERPSFGERDYCCRGYLFSEKRKEQGFLTLISSFGLLIWVRTEEGLLNTGVFQIMDQVYFCAKVGR